MSNQLEKTRKLNRVPQLAPEQQQAYKLFSESVWSKGVLSSKDKETIAVAVAHSTKCHYCINLHTKKAKKAGATLEELAEAVMVTAAIEGGGAVLHSVNALDSFDGASSNEIYQRSNLEGLKQVNDLIPDVYDAALNFFQSAYRGGKLSSKVKGLIAVAVSHTTESPYNIHLTAESAKREGATKEEIAEAILIASLMRAGGTISYITDMITAFEE